MNRLLIVSLFTLLFVIPVSLAQTCVEPYDAMVVDSDTVLCERDYSLENGISFDAEGVLLDCNGASLVGKGLGYGILLRSDRGVTIQNCNISNFEAGIYLEESSDNEIVDNYLSGNRFGIVVFDAGVNVIENNILEGNSRSDQIEIVPIRMFEEEEVEQTVIDDTIVTEREIFEKSIRIKNPDYNEAEVAAAFENIFRTYFNFTHSHVDFQRTYFYNETDGTTKVILRLIPKEGLQNLSVYERIPKCMSEFVSEMSFDQDNYEVLEEDPLIVWHFDELTDEELLTYTVFKRIDEQCKPFLLTFGIATGLIENEVIDEEPQSFNIFFALIITFVIIIIIILFSVFKK